MSFDNSFDLPRTAKLDSFVADIDALLADVEASQAAREAAPKRIEEEFEEC